MYLLVQYQTSSRKIQVSGLFLGLFWANYLFRRKNREKTGCFFPRKKAEKKTYYSPNCVGIGQNKGFKGILNLSGGDKSETLSKLGWRGACAAVFASGVFVLQ